MTDFEDTIIPKKCMHIKKNGKMYLVVRGIRDGFWQKLKRGNWEPWTYNIFDKYIDTEHSVIDIGAWNGVTTLYAANTAKHVYAIEPDPVALKELYANISVNVSLRDKITVFPGCINNTNGKVSIGNPAKKGNSNSSILFNKLKKSWVVDSLTLETFIEKYKIENCNFIKMDIEGAECFVLPNIKKYLEKNRTTLFLSIHPQFFGSKRLEGLQAIIDTLSIYKHVHNFYKKGQEIELESLLMMKRGCPLIATDLEK